MDSGVADPLYQLLFDQEEKVQAEATAALCNIVLDFSPMKKVIIEKGGIRQLVALLGSRCTELRLNAAWAMKNMLFQADFATKKNIMSVLGWENLKKYNLNSLRIINDSNVELQTQGLTIFRNLACSNTDEIDFAIEGIGKEYLMDMLEEYLTSMESSTETILQVCLVFE
jgi:hypothetical protein